MEPLTLLFLVVVAPLLFVNFVFLAEMLAGLPQGKGTAVREVTSRTTVIIPAHNEARVIRRTVADLKVAAGRAFDILVVADNCSDATAALARQLGVAVIQRNDLGKTGKGHALAFARQWLKDAPPDAVIVLDADCRIDQTSLHNLAAACLERQKPCQAINLLQPDRSADPRIQISTFAFLIKNLVRQRGLQRLTGGVHLTGTGMCLPWALFEQADLATSNIVEDIRLGIEMRCSGARPQLVEGSLVWSAHADIGETLTQRSRWEGGFLSTARAAAPRLIARGLKALEPRTLLSGLDLLVPPLALLAMINAGALLLTMIAAAAGWSGPAPAATLVVSGTLICAALIAAWWFEGRQHVSGAALLRLPFYALWKVPMYMKLLKTGAPSAWLRTGRPREKDREA